MTLWLLLLLAAGTFAAAAFIGETVVGLHGRDTDVSLREIPDRVHDVGPMSISGRRTVPASKNAKKATAKKATAKKASTAARKAPGAVRAKRGDLIILDSLHVGSPPREGEVIKVIHGEVSVSYQVKWADGRQTLIQPAAGTATVIRRG